MTVDVLSVYVMILCTCTHSLYCTHNAHLTKSSHVPMKFSVATSMYCANPYCTCILLCNSFDVLIYVYNPWWIYVPYVTGGHCNIREKFCVTAAKNLYTKIVQDYSKMTLKGLFLNTHGFAGCVLNSFFHSTISMMIMISQNAL